MRNHDHIVRPNWHIVTGESLESVRGVLDVLEEKRFRVINDNPNHWLIWAERLNAAEFDINVPIFFNRSELDQHIHRSGESIDFEKITLQSLKEYHWKHVYIIDEENSTVASNGLAPLSPAARLRHEYNRAGVPHTVIPPESIDTQAELIIEHFEQEQLENMPYMG